MACTPAAVDWALPADLLLEIVARSNIQTLIRCAALCKLLRRDILEPTFIRRITRHNGIVPPCILVLLKIHVDVVLPLSLVHPATPGAVSFFKDHLFPSVSRDHDGLLGEYYPMTSRGGLVLLCRHSHVSNSLLDLCVYDPVISLCTFISKPPGIPDQCAYFRKFVLLTTADGIGCSFLLFAGDLDLTSGASSDTTRDIIVQTFTSSTGTWGPVVTYVDIVPKRWFELRSNKEGSYSSPDGHMLLRLLAITGFMVSEWHHSGGGWALETIIDLEEKLRSTLDHDVHPDQPPHISFSRSTERSNAVLLQIDLPCRGTQRNFRFTPVLLDLERKEMHVKHLVPSSMLVEIDLSSRLRAMKIFP